MANKRTYEELEQRVLELEQAETELKQWQKKLQEPEERLKALSEASFEALFLSEKGICFDQNQAAERMFGYTRAEAIGRHGTEWIAPKDHEQVKINMASGYEKPYEVNALKKDGNTFPCEIQARMTEYQGRSIRITALRDISARKQAEEALSESEEEYKSLTNNLNVGVYRNSAGPKGKFIEANPAIVKMFGYDSREEFLKIGVSDLYKNPHERKNFTFKTAKAGSIKNEILELQKKDGTGFIGSVSAVAVMNNNGDIKYFDGIIEDISYRKRAEEALRESEKRFRLLTENTMDTIWATDQNFNMTFVNNSIIQFLGYTPEEFLGLNPSIFTPEEGLKSIQEAAENLISKYKQGKITQQKFEIKQIRKDGKTIDVEITANLLFNDKKEFIGFQGRSIDITERKKAEEALRKSEAIKNTMVSNIGDVIVIIDQNGINQYKSPNVTKLFGWAPEELVGKSTWDNVHPEDLEAVQKFFNTIGATPNATGSTELRYKRKDGSYVWIEITVVNLLHDKYVQGILGNYHDITERKTAEKALQQSEERLQAIFESSPDPIVVYDTEGHPQNLNAAFTELFGWSLDELRGRRIPFVPEEQKEIVAARIDAIYSSDKTERMQTRRLRKQGDTVDVIVSAANIKGPEGKPIGMVVNLTDISERMKLEAQLQQALKMEAMGTLAGGIAHDFNNLLMSIQGRASIMLMKKDSSHPDIRHLKGIEDNVESAADLTRQLLGFARGGKYEVRPTDLNEVIKKENRMFGRTKKEITIRGKYEKDLWSVEVDRGQIEQVLLNLYVNAWQAMPAGGDLYLETENATLDENYVKPFSIEPGKYVKISVTDTGVGMDKATQEKIFEPFFTTKEMGRGTGLGLASAYGIIKNHGGFINVYSEKGHGTTFNIYLPASEKEVIKEKKPPGDTLRGTETVLFVDDEDMIIEVAKEVLEHLDYKVLIARSGKEAIETYEKNKEQIAIVLLDMIMPDMSGGDTYDSLKEIYPDIKVLLSSGYSINGQATEIMDRGCSGFIQKPFKMKELSQKLREILDVK